MQEGGSKFQYRTSKKPEDFILFISLCIGYRSFMYHFCQAISFPASSPQLPGAISHLFAFILHVGLPLNKIIPPGLHPFVCLLTSVNGKHP